MEARFALSRATKAQLKARVVELTRAYNEAASELNGMCDTVVPYTLEADALKGMTLMVRVPKRYRVRNV